MECSTEFTSHDNVIKSKDFPRYWPFARGIHRSPVNSQTKDQRRGALMFSLICAWINGWVNNREAGDLRRHRTHYDVTVMRTQVSVLYLPSCINTYSTNRVPSCTLINWATVTYISVSLVFNDSPLDTHRWCRPMYQCMLTINSIHPIHVT